MSQSGGKKGGGKGPPKDSKNTEDKEQKENGKQNKENGKTPAKEQPEKDKDEAGSTAGEETPAASKPQSAGTNIKDAVQKVLVLCQKGEWSPVDQVLKSIEKSMAAAGEEAVPNPLLGVADTVSTFITSLTDWDKIHVALDILWFHYFHNLITKNGANFHNEFKLYLYTDIVCNS